MFIRKQLTQHGTSLYVLLDKNLRDLAGIKDSVKVTFDGKRIIIEADDENEKEV